MDHTTQQQDQLRGEGKKTVTPLGKGRRERKEEQLRVDIQNYYYNNNNNHIIINECNPRNINNDWVKKNGSFVRCCWGGVTLSDTPFTHDYSL